MLSVHGGPRRDELTLRVVGEAPRHLNAGGHAFVLADFALDEGPPPLERINEVLPRRGAGVLLVMNEQPVDGKTHAASYAAALSSGDGKVFWRTLRMLSTHLERLGIRRCQQGLAVVRRRAGSARVLQHDCPAAARPGMHRIRIDELLRATSP